MKDKITAVGALLSIGLTMGCQGMHKQEDADVDDKLQQALTEAMDKQDFRLFYTTGRRPVVPGFEQFAFKDLEARCGVKVMPGTGDTLRSEADKAARSEAYQYAKSYNLKIYDACLNKL
ncbi:hypothetical protein [Pseudoalteromonas rubra]|uniref:Lipoprotein n=1 Tax=Pseudoalteromonas rubra TaxID=43658 RepID=A0A0F4QQB4_9GAMM|nr:hypothetical protein [Pseudoalteromonas rubra]KJZ09886.1 hypothetical protein TW77_08845 [Pseudoalteromonas rubra]